MRPSNNTWSLTVRHGSLHLDGPRGSFPVRGLTPEVQVVVDALPEGTDVECEGDFDGGGTIANLVVTKIRRLVKDLSGRVMTLPDAIVAADGRLAATRARIHFSAGRITQAARDVGSLLALGDDQALAELERLPAPEQRALFEALVAWQTPRPASWRALRYIPLSRWTDAQLAEAVEQAIANGGVFGSAPGVRAEDLVTELDERKRPTKTYAKQTQRLRRAQSTEGDTFYRIATDLEDPRVIGADAAGVYIASTARAVVALFALDGRELRRWENVTADRVVEGVALQIDIGDEPCGFRLADGKRLFAFRHRIEHHDGELVWGIHSRDPATRKMRSEIVHIATGFSIAQLATWVDDVTWNAQQIFVHGEAPQTLTRDGRVLSATVPAPPAELDLDGQRIPATHAPWLFGAWTSVDAGGWIVHAHGRRLYLAASEPGAAWVHLALAKKPARIDLAPPWLAIHATEPSSIVLVALAEAMSATEIRIDGKRFAKRTHHDATLVVATPVRAWYAALVETGIVPVRSDAERDAHLYRVIGDVTEVPEDALARVLAGASPSGVEHSDHYVDRDDELFAKLTALLVGDD
ncbi:MAG TPA: hypothetical protein VK427_04300, partial [Kofleriaceae bacterium]|nr:hypothetical protein [Kofleriaceae bacterium]